ncbi:MAG: FecR family protein [Chitinophagaceae bacterium]
MEYSSKEIAELLLLEFTGKLSREEADRLELWANASEQNRTVLRMTLDEHEIVEMLLRRREDHAGGQEQLLKRIQDMIAVDHDFAQVQKRGQRNKVMMWWAAASIFMIIILGAWFWVNTSESKHKGAVVAAVTTEDIPPGRTGAILTLANGDQVSLDSINDATVALQGGVTARIVNGALEYKGVGNGTAFNTVSTPRGRQFQLILPDGSKVWLNAESSIRYPIAFVGKSRKVSVSGEAYFEVVKNPRMPFLVDVNGAGEIEVFGTHFNVNAYSNENGIYTTLLEGSISFSTNEKQKRSVMLKPLQQAALVNVVDGKGANGISVIQNVDVEKVVAWKNGVFNFNEVGFETAMRQLERWYDIQVRYPSGKPIDVEVRGEISKDVTLIGLLNVLRGVGIKCRLEGRTLLIFP